MEFLTPQFRSDELVCMDAPRGQLPSTATNGQVADRVVGIDEAGEDCRQKLARAKMKVEVFDEVVADVNKAKGKKVKPKKD